MTATSVTIWPRRYGVRIVAVRHSLSSRVSILLRRTTTIVLGCYTLKRTSYLKPDIITHWRLNWIHDFTKCYTAWLASMYWKDDWKVPRGGMSNFWRCGRGIQLMYDGPAAG